MNALMVISTAGSEKEANRIARTLVEKRLAACVNVVPRIHSYFYWKAKMSREKETLIIIKTRAGQAKRIIKEIRRLHTYALPEIIYLRLDGGEKRYLQWVHQSTAEIEGTKGEKGKKLLTKRGEKVII